ncbi:SirB2 family protein [Noviherbaspirillum sp. CPCC 100848]|uniref:SirB2 family protein n=1 Tax=Noviherbaspirillum album TaxID=3080276 RepID=A0ABU6J4C2_9BURK|nr:SirB2 family protein [Noviherbaspirillum sp. CPCC 100848]MEC4718477.1 SirB2 family protein [Noviherbaspirillum sp. CPCC 100848]
MSYLAVKHLHMSFVALSGILFFVRGLLMLADSAALQRKFFRVAPHIVDTLLLASALVLVVWSAQYPFVQSWLTAKVVALVAYIAIGAFALKRGGSKGVRAAAFVAALLVFAYIIKVAVTRQVL